jgi:hypothetical protein
VSTLPHAFEHLVYILVQIANKMGIKKNPRLYVAYLVGNHVECVHCQRGISFAHVADGGYSLQIWKVAVDC